MIKRDKNMGTLLTKNVTYTLTLDQEQLNILEELLGCVGGTGNVRNVINELQFELEKHVTRNRDSFETNYFKEDTFVEVK